MLTKIELIHQEFSGKVPHPELHGGKKPKNTWAQLEDSGMGFLEFVERHNLEHEEGNIFPSLIQFLRDTIKTKVDARKAHLSGIDRALREHLGAYRVGETTKEAIDQVGDKLNAGGS